MEDVLIPIISFSTLLEVIVVSFVLGVMLGYVVGSASTKHKSKE